MAAMYIPLFFIGNFIKENDRIVIESTNDEAKFDQKSEGKTIQKSPELSKFFPHFIKDTLLFALKKEHRVIPLNGENPPRQWTFT